MNTSERLKIARAKAGMTQAVVAKSLGMKQPHYAVFENGTREIPREKLVSIAKLLNVPIDFLMGITDEMKPYPPTKED